MQENMNSGKSHAFFTWAAENAWVPPLYFNTTTPRPPLSYANLTALAPDLAAHDPSLAWEDHRSDTQTQFWVRPDFVAKADDDAFVMLAELEARLRVELHAKIERSNWGEHATPRSPLDGATSTLANVTSVPQPTSPLLPIPSTLTEHVPRLASPTDPTHQDPLIYWGYLVKNRFMAGELYALSWSLVNWVSKDPMVKGMTKGAEDKQTAKWMRLHPKREQVRWASERCWIYDHPRAGTV